MRLISVITVVYNCVDTIERAIQSVSKQKTEYIEYIIIDGGSTDGTLDIIRKYDNCIDFWISEPDGGIYDAMNKGIACANGEYIGFLNGDDWYEDDVLGKVIESIKRSYAEVYYGNVIRVRKTGNEMWIPEDPEHLYWHFCFGHQSTFVKRKKGLRFDTEYRIAADYKMMLELYEAGAVFEYLPYVIAFFDQNGISNRQEYQTMTETVEIASKELLKLVSWKKTIYIKKLKGIYIEAEFWHELEGQKGREGFLDFVTTKLHHHKKIVCFGVGNMSQRFQSILEGSKCRIEYFVDNNATLADERRNIYLPKKLLNEKNADVVIGSFNYADEIKEQLSVMHLQDSVEIYSFRGLVRDYLEQVGDDYLNVGKKRIHAFADLLQDREG